MIAGDATQALIADKGYDAAPLINLVEANGVEAVIPPRSNRREQRESDKHLDKERHLVECLINRSSTTAECSRDLKNYQRATWAF